MTFFGGTNTQKSIGPKQTVAVVRLGGAATMNGFELQPHQEPRQGLVQEPGEGCLFGTGEPQGRAPPLSCMQRGNGAEEACAAVELPRVASLVAEKHVFPVRRNSPRWLVKRRSEMKKERLKSRSSVSEDKWTALQGSASFLAGCAVDEFGGDRVLRRGVGCYEANFSLLSRRARKRSPVPEWPVLLAEALARASQDLTQTRVTRNRVEVSESLNVALRNMPLLEHQRAAVAWMAEVEKRIRNRLPLRYTTMLPLALDEHPACLPEHLVRPNRACWLGTACAPRVGALWLDGDTGLLRAVPSRSCDAELRFLGGVLADNAGLGKTAAVVALALAASTVPVSADAALALRHTIPETTAGPAAGKTRLRNAKGAPVPGPTIVLCPFYMAEHWREEAKRVAGDGCPVVVLTETHCCGAFGAKLQRGATALVIAPYTATTEPHRCSIPDAPGKRAVWRDGAPQQADPLSCVTQCHRCAHSLRTVLWRRLVVDEAQSVFGSEASPYSAVAFSLRSEVRWCVSATVPGATGWYSADEAFRFLLEEDPAEAGSRATPDTPSGVSLGKPALLAAAGVFGASGHERGPTDADGDAGNCGETLARRMSLVKVHLTLGRALRRVSEMRRKALLLRCACLQRTYADLKCVQLEWREEVHVVNLSPEERARYEEAGARFPEKQRELCGYLPQPSLPTLQSARLEMLYTTRFRLERRYINLQTLQRELEALLIENRSRVSGIDQAETLHDRASEASAPEQSCDGESEAAKCGRSREDTRTFRRKVEELVEQAELLADAQNRDLGKVSYLEEMALRAKERGEATAPACPVCLCEAQERLVLLSCGHTLCNDCAKEVLARYPRCPLCRTLVGRESLRCVSLHDSAVPKPGSKILHVVAYLETLFATQSEARVLLFVPGDRLRKLVQDALLTKNLSAQAWSSCNVCALETLRRFSDASDNTVRVLLLSPGACAPGANLTAASHIVLLGPVSGPKEPACYVVEQVVRRALRIGQKKQVAIVRIVAHNTVEQARWAP